MKFAVKVHVQDDIASGLTIDADPRLRAAREQLDAVRRDQAESHEALRATENDRKRLTAATAQGRAKISELEAAIVRQRAAALVVPQFPARVAEAEAAVERAIEGAKQWIRREAERRRDALQHAAIELTPALNALRDAEAALDAAVRAIGVRDGVTPVLWPSSLNADGELRNAANAAFGR
jgi:chromosome segregation ATPase